MSTTLSMISRQCADGTSRTSHVQSVNASVPTPSMTGGRTSRSGSEPSTSCQIITWPLRITTGYFWVRARSGTRRA